MTQTYGYSHAGSLLGRGKAPLLVERKCSVPGCSQTFRTSPNSIDVLCPEHRYRVRRDEYARLWRGPTPDIGQKEGD